jgi:hypothetical protein
VRATACSCAQHAARMTVTRDRIRLAGPVAAGRRSAHAGSVNAGCGRPANCARPWPHSTLRAPAGQRFSPAGPKHRSAAWL